MARLLFAIRMDAAARDDGDIGTFADVKVVVHQIVHRAVGHAGGDVNHLAAGARLHGDIDARQILF
ncbi:hypothetical protein SDC9_175115 [bioreactor metagenome]|uniref:Uncharacterized protein n=1 Tax=bioreactor metagenome TaxID=1076179 RepID=A0A645GL55_9ZZZZ